MVSEFSIDYDFKTTITLDGNTITNPISGNIRKITNKQTECTMTFSNKNGSMTNYIPWNGVIKVYLGLGDTEDTPVFTGIPYAKKGRETITYSFTDLFGYLKRHVDIKIDDYSNFDGMEAGQSIIEVIDDADYSNFSVSLSTSGIHDTYPAVYMDDTLRFPTYTSRYDVIRKINDRCWDTSEYPKEPESYVFYMRDNMLFHEKQTRLEDSTSIGQIETADNIIASAPTWDIKKLINKQVVIGDSYEDGFGRKLSYEGTHSDTSSIATYGVCCGKVVRDKSLTNNGDCKTKAERIVEANKIARVKTSVNLVGFFTLIPGKDFMGVTDSAYGIEGNHRVSEVKFNFGNDTSTRVTFDNTRAIVTDFL